MPWLILWNKISRTVRQAIDHHFGRFLRSLSSRDTQIVVDIISSATESLFKPSHAPFSTFFFKSLLNEVNPSRFDAPDFFSGFIVKERSPLKSSYWTNFVPPGFVSDAWNSKTWSPVKMPGRLPRHLSLAAVFSYSLLADQ